MEEALNNIQTAETGEESPGKTNWMTPLILTAVVAFGVNIWKMFVLGYSFSGFDSSFTFDFFFFGFIIFTAYMNPFKHILVYSTIFLLFITYYLINNPPAGFWDWFGTLFVFAIIYYVVPHLNQLTPLVAVGLIIGFIVLRVVMPITYHKEAQETIAKGYPETTARHFVRGLMGNSFYSLALEQFTFFLDKKSNPEISQARLKRLHRKHYGKMSKNKVEYMLTDTLGQSTVSTDGDDVKVRFRGRAQAAFSDEKYIKPEMSRVRDDKLVPRVWVEFEPFYVTVRKQEDGTYRVVSAPESIEWEFQ